MIEFTFAEQRDLPLLFALNKKMRPEQTKKYEREIRITVGHLQTVQYIASVIV